MSSSTLLVHTQSHDYPIFICASHGTPDLATKLVPYIKGKQVLIVSNDVVAPLYLDGLKSALVAQGFIAHSVVLPDGEAHKNQDSINAIYDTLLEQHFARDCTLVALGGGVIGDMTGFAAASFMRGVDFIQVPTTLLAQVDSSVGGKTGINHPRGKNMIGAFWQPQCVLADMATFKTLPKREFAAGMAEVIKYALIMDADFLTWLEDNADAITAQDGAILGEMVHRCCDFKAQVVAEDEREAGRRALLNFGHTFGHVIEAHQGYGAWLHGEAVAVGMVQAAQMSFKLGLISADDVARIIRVIERFDLPTTPPQIAVDEALDLMGHDKKVQQGKIRLVLLRAIGDAFVTADFELSTLESVLAGA
ncbi:3-dehydroquinate synthase [Moraxella sp. FZLJ2107]|uniref:3-dehydroquinate synthase n=1 Tax=unclassified Moraxella TaxID=2685852 RepID=UPI00209C4BD9|nr:MULTISPECIES: 3-dehydroquinate synthase [unclassified Moraxella]USZ14318.1 3-dehydroquinate synthase [Moraxella sp. FZFQ2102]UTO04987.1 3-dehydroquinate synthase [Moraxella sp. FZLJ2107]UTO21721.1 3-dehydroquinate synthase [Moraxella sp. FZLJ2109]